MNMDEFGELFRKHYESGEEYSKEEEKEVAEMLEAYCDEGVKQCNIHEHIYDMVGIELLHRRPDFDPHGIFIKTVLDIGIGIGYELGRKQQTGLEILRRAQEDDGGEG